MPLIALYRGITCFSATRFFQGWSHADAGQIHFSLRFLQPLFSCRCLSESKQYIFNHSIYQFYAISVNLFQKVLRSFSFKAAYKKIINLSKIVNL